VLGLLKGVISMEEEKQFLVISGNLNEGFQFFGPFASFEEADEYTRSFNENTWISELIKPS
jgi:hypothetical protein